MFDFDKEDDEDFSENEENYEPLICGNCNGSGEGRYEGYTCVVCKGRGEV